MAALKILLIEDNKDTRRALSAALGSVVSGVQIDEAADAETARKHFYDNEYDLTILDLEIPAEPDSIIAEVANGELLLTEFRRECSGATVCVLSAHSTAEGASRAFTEIASFDVYGNGAVPSLSYVPKDKMRDAVQLAKKVDESQSDIANAVFMRVEPVDDLTPIERRLLLRVACDLHARTAVATRFGAGLSGSKVYSVKLFDDTGAPRAYLAVKIGKSAKIQSEFSNYQQLVIPLLETGALAPVVAAPRLLGRSAALAYRLVPSRDLSFYQLVSQSDDLGERVVRRLEEVEQNWLANVTPKQISLGDVRRMLVPDKWVKKNQERLIKRFTLDESKMLWIRIGTQHGDLQGENVLCSPEGELAIIDYADVGRIYPPADGVMLELSFVFHPGAAELRGQWPSLMQCEKWDKLEEYVQDCPFPKTVRACRSWAKRTTEAVSDHGVFAIAYAYAVWQAGFDEAYFETAQAIATSATRRLPA